MLKNDRPTFYWKGKPTYYNLNKVPCFLASRTEWRRRGYAVRKGEQWAGTVKHWQGRNYIYFDLFHLSQCREIAGEKAASRRFSWHIAATGDNVEKRKEANEKA